MNTATTHDYLVRLRDVIIEERQCAVALDIEGMTEAMAIKEEIIKVLDHVKVIEERDKKLAAQIRSENRRNAFLFKSTLGWIRDMMEFFGQKTVPSTYSSHGQTVASRVNGRLLSGRI